MNIAIENFCAVKRYKHEVITYRFNGLKLKRKGIDIVNSENKILFSFEPVNYSNGDKWFLKQGKSKDKKVYFKRITINVLFNLIPDEFSYILINNF